MFTYVYSTLCFLLLKIHNHHLKRIERLQKPFQFENIASTRWRLVMMEWVASTRALEVDFLRVKEKSQRNGTVAKTDTNFTNAWN